MYQKLFRPLFFHLDPERAHNITIQLMRIAGSLHPIYILLRESYNAHSHYMQVGQNKSINPINLFNLRFPNRIGLAAGYDKDGLAWRGLTALGFGHIEVGTVTPRAQEGNPKPRVFRFPNEFALINRMGFPGKGAEFVANQLSTGNNLWSSAIIGVNIGKNKDTPNEEAARDYLFLLEKFSGLADYITVNVSSPNTVGLRRLQAREHLEALLKYLDAKRSTLPVTTPILVKLAPDLSENELEDALAAISDSAMDGVIATNTTIEQTRLRSRMTQESGGLSGAPLRNRSLAVVKKIYARTDGKLPIVGVGGIMSPDDAKAMLDAGASLIQIYTGLIYAGPGIVKNILQAL